MSFLGSVAGAAQPAPPWRGIDDACPHAHADDLRLLAQALEAGLSGTAPMVALYEGRLAAYYGQAHAVAVSSGTAAVAVALAGIDWVPGDEVIVAPSCPICSVLPMLALGLRPVFCDVLPDSFGLDLAQVATARGPRTRAVFEIPMWGYPTRADRLRDWCAREGLPLVLDLAHCHGTRLHGRWLASFGDIACFSTHEGKFLSTGEGGFVLTDDAGRAGRMRSYSRFGNLDGVHFGLNFKLGGLQAALGVARLQAMDVHLARRAANRAAILAGIATPHVRELPVVPGGTVSGYALLLQTTASDGRRFVDYLDACGIPSDVKKYDNQCLYNYPLLAADARPCPEAAAMLRSLTTVPLHPGLDADDISHIVQSVNAYVP